jgi:hypothetical protein
MAKKKVDVEIGAKNKMMTGLRSASRSIKKFGKSAGKILKNVAKGALVAGAVIVGLSVKMVKAWSIQESAEKSLSEALLAQGDAVDSLMIKYKKLASAIQDETGIGDEATLAMIASLRTIGVRNDKMEEAVKLTLALGKAGMREKTALRAAADAMNGNTTALTTYIPELRSATTQAERMAIVNDLAVRGYKQLSGELDTNAGRWTELKGRLGDVFEQIGRVISSGLSLKEAMARLSERIKRFGASPKFEAFLDRLHEGIELAKNLMKVLSGGGERSKKILINIAEVIVAAFGVAGEKVVNILKAAAPIIGSLIAKGMKRFAIGSPESRVRRAKAVAQVNTEMKAEDRAKSNAEGMRLFTPRRGKERAERVDALVASMIKLEAVERGRLLNTKGLTAAEANLKSKLDTLKKSIPSIAIAPRTKRTTDNAIDDASGGNLGASAISNSTSMIGASDLFTMMQTGGTAQATVLSETQKTNDLLREQNDILKDEGVQ